jgi:hypothetical protein
MSDEKISLLFKNAIEGQQKFDYFISGFTGALFAYTAQTYIPQRLDFGPSAIEPFALLLLALSFFFGLKRIETTNLARALNHDALDAAQKAGNLTEALGRGTARGFNPHSGEIMTQENIAYRRELNIALSKQAEDEFNKVAARGERYYNFRNLFLQAGFLAILVAKLLEPYR